MQKSGDKEAQQTAFITEEEISDTEAEFVEQIPVRKHIFENCHKDPEIRSMFKSGNGFCRLRDDLGEKPIDTSYDNLIQQREVYKRIERFGVENKMALQGVHAKDILQSQAFRATYANMIADRIYDIVPYGRIYFKLIMGYYAISRVNFDRLFYHQLISFLSVITLSVVIALTGMPAEAKTAMDVITLAVISIGAVGAYTVYNTVFHSFYKNAVDVNMTSISDKIRERIFHLITAEQTCFSRISTEENSSLNDSEWKERAGVWTLAAVAYRWRVFLLKQFLDVGTHKTVRHYVWMHKYKIVYGAGFVTLAFMLTLLGLFLGVLTVPSTFPSVLQDIGQPSSAAYIFATVFLALIPTTFLWSANPAETMNQIAARIGSADAGIDVDTPIDVIFHLVGRVSTAKNEGRRH